MSLADVPLIQPDRAGRRHVYGVDAERVGLFISFIPLAPDGAGLRADLQDNRTS